MGTGPPGGEFLDPFGDSVPHRVPLFGKQGYGVIEATGLIGHDAGWKERPPDL
jgi:hypothetical protein